MSHLYLIDVSLNSNIKFCDIAGGGRNAFITKARQIQQKRDWYRTNSSKSD